MTKKATNIHSVFDRILGRKDKAQFLQQKSRAIWMTGVSGFGKTTIAIGIEKELQQRRFRTQIFEEVTLEPESIKTLQNKS